MQIQRQKSPWISAATVAAIACALGAAVLIIFAASLAVGMLDSFEHRLLFSRISLVLLIAAIGCTAYAFRDRTTALWNAFFGATSSPFNLAIVRIVFFGTLLLWLDITQIRFFSRLPSELLVGPVGLRWVPRVLPIINNEWLVMTATALLVLFCAMAMIGLYTRVSATATVLLALYVLVIPQFYGKVNHYHHFIWFGAILAASRCGDALSIDSIRYAWRRADKGILAPPPDSQVYALPMRFIWLMIGLIYFFPGFWKFWTSGVDWIATDNLKYHMYAKWLELGGWTPDFFRIDQYPLLYQLSAAATIAFELAFILLIFFPRIRLFVAANGVMFHTMLAIFLRITLFWTLQTIYVSFIDWKRLFERLGRRIFPQPLYLAYDGNCQLCRRTVGTLRMLDLFGRIEYVNALDEDALRRANLEWLDQAALMYTMHAVAGRRTWQGYDAYRALAARIPALWPVLPLLYIWPVTAIGRAIYRRVADARTCSPAYAGAPLVLEPSPMTAPVRLSRLPVVIVGATLFTLNALAGASGGINAWPIAGYPKFERIAGPQVTSLTMTAVDRNGRETPLNEQPMIERFSSERWAGMIWHLLNNPSLGPQSTRLAALGRLMIADDPSLEQAAAIRFYKVRLTTIPEQLGDNPLQRELLYELKR